MESPLTSHEPLDLKTVSEERRFQLLVEAVRDYAIYMLDSKGHVASWNPGAQRFKGYLADEIIGRHFSCFYTPEDREAGVPARALATASSEGKYEAEGWRVRKDGQRFWASVVIDPIRDELGRLIGFAKVTRDITERKGAQDALKESEERFRILVQGVTDYAIYMIDPGGHVTNWNSGAERSKGYLADEIVGRHFSCFYTPEDREAGVPVRALATAIREGRYEAEGWRVRKDGQRFWASVVIDPIHNEQGRLIGFAKVTRDITERKKAQEELDQARAALFQSQKMEVVGQLTGGIAHDFNNLLQVVIGNLELLQRDVPEDAGGQMHKRLDNAMRGARRAAALTQQLLAFSRRQPLSPAKVNANQLVLGMISLLDRTLGETVEVETMLDDGLWSVIVDANQLESALLNLAVNSRDAMPEGGSLTIETANVHLDEAQAARGATAPGDYVVIRVSDTGSGMTPDVLARASEPFFTTKEVGRGTGLGLSQVYGFVAQSGGQMKIHSEPGEGTTVKIYLPRFTGADADTDAGGRSGPDMPKGRNTETVLVVEDDPQVRDYTVEVVRELGYRVIEAADGPSALALLQKCDTSSTLLFTDMVLPGGMNGKDLAAEARSRHTGLRILFTTGYARKIAFREDEAASDIRIVPKPFAYADLAAGIRAALNEGG